MAIRTTDYVKFIRGTQAAFTALAQKDSNTLYFISEEGATTGQLYLGSKLISGGTGTSELGSIIIESIGDKQILYYDYASGSWVNGSIYEVVSIMTGASENADGLAGLVPVPKAGEQNLFLRGDGKWVAPVNFDSNVFEDNADGKTSLVGFEEAAVGDILRKSSVGNLEWISEETFLTSVNNEINTLKGMIERIEGGVSRTIVDSIDDIDVDAEDAEKYIYMVPKEDTTGVNNLYDEYMVIDGKIEQIGANLSGEITGYVKTTTFNATVQNLQAEMQKYVPLTKYNTEVGTLNSTILDRWTKETIVEQVDYLTDLLTWYQL